MDRDPQVGSYEGKVRGKETHHLLDLVRLMRRIEGHSLDGKIKMVSVLDSLLK